jgi:hypothetical protein
MVIEFVNDINGVLIWNPMPAEAETAHWSGDAKSGYAFGEGLLTWYHHKKEVSSYQGFMKHGKPEGFGIYKFADGDIYAGQWKSGLRHGEGKQWFKDGRFYSGLWENDKKLG